jgi:hypothetical protein
MLSAPSNPRGEEKLRLILGQLTALRSRLNGLAYQQGIFVGLALLISAAVVVTLAAFMLRPLAFLTLGAVTTLACIAGLTLVGRRVYRMHKSAEAVAALVDERADLKGRVTTLVALQGRGTRSSLWPYLVEDATLRREDFTPARIERHRVSRTVYGLLVALMVAGLVIPFGYHRRTPSRVALAKHSRQSLTLNLRDLNIQPSDRSAQDSARLSGDPKTMRKLAQMLADAQRKEQNKDLLSKMMRSAHDLAGNLQDKITGRHAPPLDIRLADNGGSGPAPPAKANSNPPKSNGPQSGHAGEPPARGSEDVPQGKTPGGLAMQTPPPTAPTAGQPQDGADSRPFADQQRSGKDDSGSAAHGAGSDPQSLYGKADSDAKGDGSFQIAIDARPGSSGHAANRALPPKVRAPLNDEQHPDEPIGRTAVPAEDRSTIKRIFER